MPNTLKLNLKDNFTKEDLIYLAGIIDGEGCVKINRQARCEITNTSKELIDWLYNTFGGHTYTTKQITSRKLQYRWVLRKLEIKKLLPLVLPYLKIKKEEAEQSIILTEIKKSHMSKNINFSS